MAKYVKHALVVTSEYWGKQTKYSERVYFADMCAGVFWFVDSVERLRFVIYLFLKSTFSHCLFTT